MSDTLVRAILQISAKRQIPIIAANRSSLTVVQRPVAGDRLILPQSNWHRGDLQPIIGGVWRSPAAVPASLKLDANNMPILSHEPDIYPERLFDSLDEDMPEDAEWWALYTLSRREKQLVRLLRSQRIRHYCPTIEKTHRSPNGRLRKSYIPLFSNYVFLLGSELDRYTAKTTNCVSREIAIHDPQQLVFDLQQIHKLVLAGCQLTPESQIESGTRVRVKSGVLKGREGCVISRRGERRLLVSVDFLQKGASVLLDDVDLESI